VFERRQPHHRRQRQLVRSDIDGAVIGLRAGRQLNIGRQLRAIDRVFLSLRGINVNGCFGRFACIRSFCLSLAFASSRVSGPSSRQIAINAALFQRCKIAV
jgi:hypothetical protein